LTEVISPDVENITMLERQERQALALLVCVVTVVLAAQIILGAGGRSLVAKPYSPEVPDGALVLLEGKIESIKETSTGGHLILTVNGTRVFLPSNVAAGLDLHENESVSMYGLVQTYRGEREVVVNAAGDLEVLE